MLLASQGPTRPFLLPGWLVKGSQNGGKTGLSTDHLLAQVQGLGLLNWPARKRGPASHPRSDLRDWLEECPTLDTHFKKWADSLEIEQKNHSVWWAM